jgi:hypothetical protein
MNDRDERLLREVLAEDRRDRFDAGFAERATARWMARRTAGSPLSSAVVTGFVKLAPFAAAAVVLLALNNMRHRERDRGQTVMQALLGLSPAVESARAVTPRSMTLDELYGLGVISGSGQE